MKKGFFLLTTLLLPAEVFPNVPFIANDNQPAAVQAAGNQWKGKKVAFLGDSITDPRNKASSKKYWQFLAEMLGIEPYVYAVSGRQWNDIDNQAEKLEAEHGEDVDAIIVFVGTNDYNAGVPLGQWYTYADKEVQVKGGSMATRRQRTPILTDETLRGRINRAMDFLKSHYPTKQVIVLTPIHRAYFRSGQSNIQPDESYPNQLGLYMDSYIQVVRETANVWAVPVIDLNSLSGLYPLNDGHARYFHNADTDRLHPNNEGHERMARTLMYQLLALPAGF